MQTAQQRPAPGAIHSRSPRHDDAATTFELRHLADRVFQRVLRLLARIESGERPDLQLERSRIRNDLEEGARRAAAPTSAIRNEDYELAQQALVYWTDEVLTAAVPEWKDILLEIEFYGPPRKRAWKFYVEGETRARNASPEVAEIWYLALVLGFEGDIRDAFRNHLSRELPGSVDDDGKAREMWARQLEQRLSESAPADMAGEPLIGHVAPLAGRTMLAWAASLFTVMLGGCGALLMMYLRSGG